ncbi:MAG: DUF1854 domain-containing protein [Anaerolineales bacterium]|nr:DUF1854 domain-containing protein [Anaerolineales bacterium]
MAKGYETVYLDPGSVHLTRRGDTLSMALNGVYYPRVVLRSCFPVSDNNIYISVRDATAEEQPEIGIIEDWMALDEEDRQAVAAEMGLHYFVPRIHKVLRIKEELGFLYWSVETDKGPKEFVMHNSVVHYARQIGPERWLLIDLNQARYEIPAMSALDRRSQRLVADTLSL